MICQADTGCAKRHVVLVTVDQLASSPFLQRLGLAVCLYSKITPLTFFCCSPVFFVGELQSLRVAKGGKMSELKTKAQ